MKNRKLDQIDVIDLVNQEAEEAIYLLESLASDDAFTELSRKKTAVALNAALRCLTRLVDQANG